METIKNWFKNMQLATMNAIAVFVIFAVLVMYAAQLYKWNSFTSRAILPIEVYERLVTNLNEKTFQFVFTILAFFFGKDLGKKEEKDKQITTPTN